MKKHKAVEEEMASFLTVLHTLQTENKVNATDASYTICHHESDINLGNNQFAPLTIEESTVDEDNEI